VDFIKDGRKSNFFWLENNLIDRTDLSIYEKIAYSVLARHSNSDGMSFPSYRTIALKMGCSERKAKETIADLIEKKLIEKENRCDSKNNAYTSNIYLIKEIPSAPDALGVVHQMHQGSAPDAHRAPSGAPSKEVPSENSHHHTRARVKEDDDDGALSLKEDSEELDAWRKIDQRPLTEVGVPEIDWPGLMKLKRIGASTHLIEQCITSFVAKVPGRRLKNPTGLLVAQIAAKVGGLSNKPSDVGLANQAFKDVH